MTHLQRVAAPLVGHGRQHLLVLLLVHRVAAVAAGAVETPAVSAVVVVVLRVGAAFAAPATLTTLAAFPTLSALAALPLKAHIAAQRRLLQACLRISHHLPIRVLRAHLAAFPQVLTQLPLVKRARQRLLVFHLPDVQQLPPTFRTHHPPRLAQTFFLDLVQTR